MEGWVISAIAKGRYGLYSIMANVSIVVKVAIVTNALNKDIYISNVWIETADPSPDDDLDWDCIG